jgi:hypothetical protein
LVPISYSFIEISHSFFQQTFLWTYSGLGIALENAVTKRLIHESSLKEIVVGFVVAFPGITDNHGVGWSKVTLKYITLECIQGLVSHPNDLDNL